MAQVTFRLNRPRKSKGAPLVDKPVSILVQLYINTEIHPEIATGEKVNPKHWNFEKQRAKTSCPNFAEINDNLIRIEAELKQFWRDNINDLSKITSQSITPAVRGKSSTTQKKRIFIVLDNFLSEYRNSKDSKTLGRYEALKTRLTAFDLIYPIDFYNLDHNFYDAFKKYLYSIPNPNYPDCSLHYVRDTDTWDLLDNCNGAPVGIFDDTVFKYFVNLKTFLLWASKRGEQVNPVYKSWQILKRKHPPIALTLDELERLETTVMPSKHLEIARDYLILECRTGQRISDIKAFSVKDCTKDKWIVKQKKGNRLSAKTVTVHFVGYCAPALVILQKYNYDLPKISEQKLNKNIKKACQIAGIDSVMFMERWAGGKRIRIHGKKYEYLSSHTGRKTFITIALSQGMPVEIVMELTGISEYQTIKHYKSKFESEVLERYLNSIQTNIAVMKKAN
jgi:site-specific recombinase XerD